MRAYEAVNRGDVEGLVALTDPAVVWEEGGIVFPDLRRRTTAMMACGAGSRTHWSRPGSL
jgi:ketosteroid isomerase-like protein